MNLRRIFATAVVRRLAYVFVAAVLAYAGIGRASAQDYSRCFNPSDPGDDAVYCPTREEAYAQAVAACQKLGIVSCTLPPSHVGGSPTYTWGGYRATYRNNVSGNRTVSRNYWTASQCATSGHVWNELRGSCQKSCNSRPVETVKYNSMVLNGSVGCFDGCEAMINSTGAGDGTYTKTFVGGNGSLCNVLPNDCSKNGAGYSMNYGMSMCQPQPEDCAANEVKDPITGVCNNGCERGQVMNGSGVCEKEKDDCPAGNIKSPAGVCLPGEGQCAEGEAKRPNGTCGKDSDGDGKADEDDDDPNNDPDKESASGGDSCDAPPSCSGGAIACLQVKIQWRIDCNTRKNAKLSGGTCSAMPVCTGKGCDAMEYAQLMQQWKSACALEKLANKGTSEEGADGTDANKNGVADALEGRLSTDSSETPSVTKFGARFSTSVIKEDNIFGGGSCPEPPTFTLMKQTISGADFPYWCQAMAILRALILIFGAYTALKILMGWGF